LKFTPFNSTAWLKITSALNVQATWREVPSVPQAAEGNFVNPQEMHAASADFVVLNVGDGDVSRFREAGREKNQVTPDQHGMVWRLERSETRCSLKLTSENVDPIRIKFEHTFEGFVRGESRVPNADAQAASAFKIGGFDASEVVLGASGVNPVKKVTIQGMLEGNKKVQSLVFTAVRFQWTQVPVASLTAPVQMPFPTSPAAIRPMMPAPRVATRATERLATTGASFPQQLAPPVTLPA